MKKKKSKFWLPVAIGMLIFLGIKALLGEGKETNSVLIKKAVLKDGIWHTDKHTYKYKKDLTGKLPDAEEDITFTVLSNNDEIVFDDVVKIIFNKEKDFNEEEFVLAQIKK